MINPAELESLDVFETRTKQVLVELNSKPIIADMLQQLRSQLPKNLKYHNGIEEENSETPTHTEDVLHDTILFALADGINDEHALELLGIMASFHDAAFLKQYANNEDICASMATEAMREAGYSEDDCTTVYDGIIATKVEMVGGILTQRKAPNQLAGYVLDGDVSNFGRPDFRHKSDLILEELKLQYPDKPPVEKGFLTSAYHFIKNHEWNTQAAKRLRSPQQQINIQNLGLELDLVA